MNDEDKMLRAIELAKQAFSLDEVPIGAVIFHGDEIVGEGYNLKESSGNPTSHAEMIAIEQAAKKLGRWRLFDCELFVTLEPCPMCAGAIVNARLDRVVFGATDQKAGACVTLYSIPQDYRLNHRAEVVGGVLKEECITLLQSFFKAKR